MREAPSLTDERRAIILQALEDGLPRKRAAALAGVVEGTFYGWLRDAERDDAAPELRRFAVEIEMAEARCQEKHVKIIGEASAAAPNLSLKFLGRRFADEWGRRDNIPTEPTKNRDEETSSLRQVLLERFERLMQPAMVIPDFADPDVVALASATESANAPETAAQSAEVSDV